MFADRNNRTCIKNSNFSISILNKKGKLYCLRVFRREVLIIIKGLKKIQKEYSDQLNKNEQDKLEVKLLNMRFAEKWILCRLY